VETTYLFHLWFVLVLTMVRSRLHHLRHQCQISIFASSNHIHQHTYFKNPNVHIQVFHILHNHTMKLLQAFKSFFTRDSIVENQQRKLVRCKPHNSAAKTDSLQALQFRQWILTSLQPTHFQQPKLIRCMQLNFGSESQFRCSQYTFSSECWFTAEQLNFRSEC
jgi:hypothetical protein